MLTPDDIAHTLDSAAALVESWGQARLPSGKMLGETLTLRGLPLWDAAAVDLARVFVPAALAPRLAPHWFADRLRPHLSQAKHTLLDQIRRWQAWHGQPLWPEQPVVLCLGFGAYIYRDVLDPVVAQLASRDDVSTVSLDHDLRRRTDRGPDRTGRFLSVWQHWDGEAEARLRALRRDLRAVVADLYAKGALAQIVGDGDPCRWSQLQETFSWFFRSYLPRFLPFAAVSSSILERHRPALVVSPDVSDPRARLCCLIARQRGIPSLEIQFGTAGADAIEWRFSLADRLAVWGEQAREIMISKGVSVERIVMTGSPRHDAMVNVPDTEVARTRARLGIPAGKAMVLLASVYYLQAYATLDAAGPRLLDSMKDAIFQSVGSVPGICLVVKPHPREDAAETRRLAGTRAGIKFVDRRDDIRELIRACDAFISFGSTATVDSLIANKLTICPAFPGWNWGNFYLHSGATLVPHSAEELADCLRIVTDGSRERVLAGMETARQRFLRNWIGEVDGRAAARIAGLARQIAQYDRFQER